MIRTLDERSVHYAKIRRFPRVDAIATKTVLFLMRLSIPIIRQLTVHVLMG